VRFILVGMFTAVAQGPGACPGQRSRIQAAVYKVTWRLTGSGLLMDVRMLKGRARRTSRLLGRGLGDGRRSTLIFGGAIRWWRSSENLPVMCLGRLDPGASAASASPFAAMARRQRRCQS